MKLFNNIQEIVHCFPFDPFAAGGKQPGHGSYVDPSSILSQRRYYVSTMGTCQERHFSDVAIFVARPFFSMILVRIHSCCIVVFVRKKNGEFLVLYFRFFFKDFSCRSKQHRFGNRWKKGMSHLLFVLEKENNIRI